jgi:hypothetical protein
VLTASQAERDTFLEKLDCKAKELADGLLASQAAPGARRRALAAKGAYCALIEVALLPDGQSALVEVASVPINGRAVGEPNQAKP